jgi:hypothetical protein
MEPVGSQYKIGGCTVLFPHKAYGTQLSFMSKVITALEQGTNALLEAPTGLFLLLMATMNSSLTYYRRLILVSSCIQV